MKHKEIFRIKAHVFFLETLLFSILDNCPDKYQILSQFAQASENFSELAIADSFSDEELQIIEETHEEIYNNAWEWRC
jgi:hypothetical protein